MGLIQEKPTASFDLNKIRRGCLLWGKHSSWTEGKAGFVTAAMENQTKSLSSMLQGLEM